MYRPPRPQIPHMGWGYHRPPCNPQWIRSREPRAPFYGQRQRFYQPRQPFQPVNDNFWCETCDRGFPTEDILNKHKQQHQKCNIDGCQFIAHPKVITKHIQMQHSTGLYKKIANLKNPEEIEKWREERRKRYPTKSNIDKKAAELKEKIERGEKMGLGRERRYRDKPNFEQNNKSGQGVKRRSNMRNENQPRSKVKRNNPTENSHKNSPKNKQNQQISSIEDDSLKPFAGILNLQMDSDEEIENDTNLSDLIEDDDCEIKTDEFENTFDARSEPVVCGALSALMCDYGSSDEEENCKIPTQTDKRHIKVSLETNNIIENQPVEDENHLIIRKEIQPNKDHMKFTQALDSIPKTVIINETELKTKEIESKTVSAPVACTKTIDIKQTDDLKAEDYKQTHTAQVYEAKLEDTIQEITPKDDESDSGPEEVKAEISKEDNLPSVPQVSRNNDVRKKLTRVRTQTNQRRRPKLPSTLLQKLLFKEMQQERNIVLQCIRYIRRNNYFDK